MQDTIQSLIRTIPDYPKQGIMFRDITTLLKAPNGLQLVVDGFVAQLNNQTIDKVVRIESPTAHREAETAKAHRG